MRMIMTIVFVLVQAGLLYPSIALGQFKNKPAQGAQQATNPKVQQAKTPVVASGMVPVTYETHLNGTRTMIVTLEAPTADATVQRSADVITVILKSTTWFCERPDRTATAGQFSTKVRNMLNAHLAGTTPAPQSALAVSAPQGRIEDFAMHLFADDPRVFADGSAPYTSPNAGPTEIKRNDCYTRDEMQTIKNEVARIVRARGTN